MRPRSPSGVIVLLSAAVLILLLQTLFLRGLHLNTAAFQTRPLDEFPSTVGRWKSIPVSPPSPELVRALHADELLSRDYRDDQSGFELALLIAYYRTQSHVNQQYDLEEYLPEEGWAQSETAIVLLPQQLHGPIPVRTDLVLREHERRLILRWFQIKDRVLADERRLRFYQAINAMANHRTDLARVQIVAPVLIDSPKQARERALDFAGQVVALTAATLFSQ